MAHSKRHLILCWLLAGTCLLCAQSGPASENATSVRLLSWSGDLAGLRVEHAGSPIPSVAHESILGPVIALKSRPSLLRIQREKSGPADTQPLTLAEMPLPTAGSQFIVLLAPAPEGGLLPLVGRVIDSSPQTHPVETIRVLNLSSKNLALRISGSTHSLNPGAETFIPFAADASPTAPVEVAVQTPDGWLMVSRSLRPTPKSSRIFCLVRDGRASTDDPAAPVDTLFFIDQESAAPVALAQR